MERASVAVLAVAILAVAGTPVAGAPALDARSAYPEAGRLAEELDFRELMDFEYEPGDPIPEKIRAYDGKEIVIKGYMDVYTPEDTREFFLMSASCGCDGETKLNHFVDVQLEGQVVGYSPELLIVRGTFRVGEVEEDGFVSSIFQIEGRIE